jgi:hypothetical protein
MKPLSSELDTTDTLSKLMFCDFTFANLGRVPSAQEGQQKTRLTASLFVPKVGLEPT